MIRPLRSALHDLRARPLRTVLTALSMLVGVLAVVGVSAADQLSTGYVIAAHEQLRGRAATYALTTSLAADEVPAAEDWLSGVRTRIGPQDASATLVVQSTVRTPPPAGASVVLDAQWVSGELNDLYRRPVVTGGWGEAGATGALAVMLNEAAAGRLAITDLPATVPLSAGADSSHTAVVTGIIADGLPAPTLYGYLTDVARDWPPAIEGGVTTMYLVGAAGAHDPAAQVLHDAAAVAGIPVADGEVQRVDTVEEARASAEVVRRAFVACAVVALVVAGIGILNIGLASLQERSRELIVRRAVGARRVDVFTQVVGSHVLLALAVSTVAVAVVLIGVYLVAPALTPNTFIADPVTVPWPAVVNGTVAAVLTSLAGAAVPAVAATRLAVADALRA